MTVQACGVFLSLLPHNLILFGTVSDLVPLSGHSFRPSVAVVGPRGSLCEVFRRTPRRHNDFLTRFRALGVAHRRTPSIFFLLRF